MHKTRNGVLGRSAKKSGSPRSKLATAISSDEIRPNLVAPRFDSQFAGQFMGSGFLHAGNAGKNDTNPKSEGECFPGLISRARAVTFLALARASG